MRLLEWPIRVWRQTGRRRFSPDIKDKFMTSLLTFGAGYRTYAVAILLVLCVVAEKLFGLDIPGFDPGADWLSVMLDAVGLGTLRASIGGN